MKKFALAAAAVIVLGLPALAQTSSETTKPNNDAGTPRGTGPTEITKPNNDATGPNATIVRGPAPVSGKTFSVETSTIGELLDNPAAKAIFQKYLPDVVANPQLDMGRDLHLPDIVQYEPSITPDKLAAIDAELKALPPQ